MSIPDLDYGIQEDDMNVRTHTGVSDVTPELAVRGRTATGESVRSGGVLSREREGAPAFPTPACKSTGAEDAQATPETRETAYRTRPRLLDLFCGAGGAAVGYHRAGFDVVGVDNRPQPNYPFAFEQRDALEYLREMLHFAYGEPGDVFSAIHASPPCQAYVRSGNVDRDRHPDLIGPTRKLLWETGLPWVIENVPGAPMRPDAVLCGSQFGLAIRRHRWFEFSWGEPLLTLACDHSQPITGVYGNAHGTQGAYPGMLPGDYATWSREMGIDWMTTDELREAIPPAYTAVIGQHLLEHLKASLRRRSAHTVIACSE